MGTRRSLVAACLLLLTGALPARAADAVQTIDVTIEPLVVLSLDGPPVVTANTAYVLTATTKNGRIVAGTRDATKAPLVIQEGLVYVLSVPL